MHSGAFQTLLLCAPFCALGQGTFVYDQQSSTDEATLAGNSTIQQIVPPYGQSFTPSLSGIDFIRLKLNDRNRGNGLGATLSVNLRGISIDGTVLSSTDPVALPSDFAGTVNFFFPSTVSLTPGTIYYFEPVVVSGDLWNLDAEEFLYPGGSTFIQGQPLPGSDFWFREGIIVPEPSSLALALSGFVCFVVLIRRRRNC